MCGARTYTLAYDADREASPKGENRLIQVKKNNTVIATFVYDGDGNRVKATVAGTTTTFIGGYYELTGSQVTKYYFAESNWRPVVGLAARLAPCTSLRECSVKTFAEQSREQLETIGQFSGSVTDPRRAAAS